MLRAGFALLLVALLVGVLVPVFGVPKRAVSAHVLGVVQGILLAVAGLVWPRLALRRAASIAATVLLLYGCAAAWIANLGAAIWPAGGGTFPLVAARGTTAQELFIAIALRTSAIALIGAVLLMLVGLCRTVPSSKSAWRFSDVTECMLGVVDVEELYGAGSSAWPDIVVDREHFAAAIVRHGVADAARLHRRGMRRW